jgi:hypothetical protein
LDQGIDVADSHRGKVKGRKAPGVGLEPTTNGLTVRLAHLGRSIYV